MMVVTSNRNKINNFAAGSVGSLWKYDLPNTQLLVYDAQLIIHSIKPLSPIVKLSKNKTPPPWIKNDYSSNCWKVLFTATTLFAVTTDEKEEEEGNIAIGWLDDINCYYLEPYEKP